MRTTKPGQEIKIVRDQTANAEGYLWRVVSIYYRGHYSHTLIETWGTHTGGWIIISCYQGETAEQQAIIEFEAIVGL